MELTDLSWSEFQKNATNCMNMCRLTDHAFPFYTKSSSFPFRVLWWNMSDIKLSIYIGEVHLFC